MCLSNRSALQGATWRDVSNEARRVPADPHVPVESERLARRDVEGCFERSPEGPCGPSCACRIGAPCKARRGGMFRTKPGGSLRTLMCLSNRSALQGATWRLAEVFDGLVLAGGQSRRMRTAHGGQADKGLMTWRGEPLVAHACRQLRAQGAGSLWISANRHFDDYAAYGTVVSDDPAHADCGPLAGVLAGLRRSRSPWLFVLPVDVLRWPEDLGARLGAAARP